MWISSPLPWYALLSFCVDERPTDIGRAPYRQRVYRSVIVDATEGTPLLLNTNNR